jgi:4'-phosphopantetheinyl transferase
VARLVVPKRRQDYLLGRFTARVALAAARGHELAARRLCRYEIRPDPSGAPEVLEDGKPLRLSFSLSHSAGHAVVVLGPPDCALGCDLETIEPRSPGFLEDYLTPDEQAFVADYRKADQALRTTLLWCAKESVMKATGEGLRLAAASVQVTAKGWPRDAADAQPWWPFEARVSGSIVPFGGWWRTLGRQLLAVAMAPSASAPTPLEP